MSSNTTISSATFTPGSSQLIVSGSAQIGGVLTLALTSLPTQQSNITLIVAQSIQGTFSSVLVNSSAVPGLEACQRVTATPVYGSNSLSVSLVVDSSECGPSAALIGGVVGGVVGLAALAAIIGGVAHHMRSTRAMRRMNEQLELHKY